MARCLVRATPTEIGSPSSVAHASPDGLGDLGRRAEELLGASDVGKGLVDRDPLDERREVTEHLDGGVTQPLIVLEVAADEDELGAELARLAPGIPPCTPKAFAS